jgi:putative PIN family toxin of toxin-antitoxin system
MRIVIDTNVLVAALRSNRGASFRLLQNIDSAKFTVVVTVPLVLEYEEQLKAQSPSMGLKARDIDDVLDYVCSIAEPVAVFFLWRPTLRDADDDMLLEAAVAGQCSRIITFNQRDFEDAKRFGITIQSPGEFLKEIQP